jgi:cellobiose-specific phosphotransferase system component IIC
MRVVLNVIFFIPLLLLGVGYKVVIVIVIVIAIMQGICSFVPETKPCC